MVEIEFEFGSFHSTTFMLNGNNMHRSRLYGSGMKQKVKKIMYYFHKNTKWHKPLRLLKMVDQWGSYGLPLTNIFSYTLPLVEETTWY